MKCLTKIKRGIAVALIVSLPMLAQGAVLATCDAPTTRDNDTELLPEEIDSFNYKFTGPSSIQELSPKLCSQVFDDTFDNGVYKLEITATDIYGITGEPGTLRFKMKDGLVVKILGKPRNPGNMNVENQ